MGKFIELKAADGHKSRFRRTTDAANNRTNRRCSHRCDSRKSSGRQHANQLDIRTGFPADGTSTHV